MKKFLLCLCALMLWLPGCNKKTEKQEEPPKAQKTVDLKESPEVAAPSKSEDSSDKEDSAEVADNSQRPIHNRQGVDSRRAGRPPSPNAKPENETEKTDDTPNSAFDFSDEAEAPAPAADKAAPENKAAPDDKAVAAAPPQQKVRPATRPPSTKPQNTLSGVDMLINTRDLREQTGYAGTLIEAPLTGQTPTRNYNFMRLATDDKNVFGFAIQVWKPGNESAAIKRYEELFKQSFGGRKLRGVATDAFVATHHKINELGFFERTKRAAVMISCSTEICSVESMKNIVSLIQKKL